MYLSDFFDALHALDTDAPLADRAALFPGLRNARTGGAAFPPMVGLGWSSMVLRLYARLDAAAARAGETIPIVEVKEKFGLLRVYLDLSHADRYLQTLCEALLAEAEAESACRCQRCGARGELARDRGYLAVLCPRHQSLRAVGAVGPAPMLSAHSRLRLAARFGAEGWHLVETPFGGAMLRLRLVEDGVAFVISLRADPGAATPPYVVAAALARADGAVLEMPGDAVLAREADLAARLAAEIES